MFTVCQQLLAEYLLLCLLVRPVRYPARHPTWHGGPPPDNEWELAFCPHGKYVELSTGKWIAKGDVLPEEKGAPLDVVVRRMAYIQNHASCDICQDWLKRRLS